MSYVALKLAHLKNTYLKKAVLLFKNVIFTVVFTLYKTNMCDHKKVQNPGHLKEKGLLLYILLPLDL